jgi:GNAT superfamily N-acetyltransferase
MGEQAAFTPIDVELRDRRRVRLREFARTTVTRSGRHSTGIDIVAGARYYVQADGETCEFAVTVADSWQGAGLSSRLMRELIQGARARGFTHMEGFVLAGNTGMLTLARRLGFTVKPDPDDARLKIVRLDLPV